MAIIHVLDEHTINKIAAGEVVERPASVVKELVENSIDAGAASIEIEIAEGGSSYIRITDNGCGMSEEDARLAVLRHATSKIRQVEDLFDIASLGFRGEALASIAAVSRLSLITRQPDSEMGTRVTLEGGVFTDCMPYGAQPGTTIEVKELFFNTPARRKFLKTERTEGSKIQDIIGKLALSHTHIAFKLIVDDRVAMVTPGNGSLMDAIAALYGYKVTEDVFAVAYEAEGIVIEGAVSKPTLLKSSRTWQTVIVNDRVISDRTISKAIDNAYHALLPKGGYPLIFLSIVVPSDSVDINVHPRKSEVKFSDDKPLFRAVYRAVLQALTRGSEGSAANGSAGTGLADRGRNIAAPMSYEKLQSGSVPGYEVLREPTQDLVEQIRAKQYDTSRWTRGEQTSLLDGEKEGRTGTFPRSYTEEDKDRFRAVYGTLRNDDDQDEGMSKRAFGTGQPESSRRIEGGQETSADRPDRLYETERSEQLEAAPGQSRFDRLLPLGQIASCYILAKRGDDLYIIDQHAAHERIRYDKLCRSAERIPSQELLVPIFLAADGRELELAEAEQAVLYDLGFAVEQGGPTQLKITELPIDIEEGKAEEILRFIFSFLEDHQHPTKAQLRHEMLAYASCRGAVKAGHTLNTYQMATLIDDLFATDKPYVCPHGRPTIIKFTPDELGRLFNRD